jgi:myosin heavy chain 6/7
MFFIVDRFNSSISFIHFLTVCAQLEDEQRTKDELREQMAASERRVMVIAGELEELRTQLEAAERARKSAESDMNDAMDRVSELVAANASLTAARRKFDADMQAMQV